MEITRRNLLKTMTIGAVSVAGAASLIGCSPTKQKEQGAQASSADDANPKTDYASQVVDAKSCDIVIVGAGISGFAAGVQTLLNGANAIIVESQETEGGNGAYTDGIGAVQSAAQKNGVINKNMKTPMYAAILNPGDRPTKTDYTPLDIIQEELETYNYDLEGERWYDMLSASGSTIDWLLDQGVELMEGVDNYEGEQQHNTSHWWKAGLGGGLKSYIVPMSARFQELGGTLLCETKAEEIILEDGAARGIYATTPEGIIRIDSKAVILATGGFNDNAEMLKQIGIDRERLGLFTAPAGHDGDGIKMALACGGKSWMENACLLQWPMNDMVGIDSNAIVTTPYTAWINDNGARFCNECCAMYRGDRGAAVLLNQHKSWMVMDQAIFDKMTGTREDIAEFVQMCLDKGALVKVDSLEAMAEGMGVDPAILQETITAYNDDCARGVDVRFGKDAAYMLPISQAPFYYCQNNGVYTVSSVGGISTTIDGEVRADDPEVDVIEDLYAVGVDGCELWKGFYNIKIASFCNTNNVHTGRRAANKACSKL